MAEPRAPLEYNRLWQMRLWLFAVFFFLYAPLVALIVFSFNDSKRTTVWRGFTVRYYEKLFGNDSLLLAFGNSLTIAFVATLISLVIGAFAAILLWRYRFWGKTAVEGAFTLPLVVPEICMGVVHAAVLHPSHTLAQRAPLAAQSRLDYHRPCLVLLPLRRACRARAGSRASIRSRRRRRAIWAPTTGRSSATCSCRISGRP